jgi:hypothetical protein
MSLAVFWNFIGAGILAVIAPWLLRELGQFGVLLLFSGTNLLAWFLCSWLIPDTGIEALEDVFQRLDITTWFMFKYTVRKITWRVTKPLDWILNLPDKAWSDSGFGRKPRPPREEFEDAKAKANASQFYTDTAPLSNHYPMGEFSSNNGHAAGGI